MPPWVAKEKIGTLLLASEMPVPIPRSRTVVSCPISARPYSVIHREHPRSLLLPRHGSLEHLTEVLAVVSCPPSLSPRLGLQVNVDRSQPRNGGERSASFAVYPSDLVQGVAMRTTAFMLISL